MRYLDLIGSHDVEAKALRYSAYKSVNDYVEARLARVKAPVSLNLSPPLHQIVTGEELSFIAIQWQNCLRAPPYRIALGMGTKVFILMDGAQSDGAVALASFERNAFGLHLDECEIPIKKRAPDEIRQRMVDLLVADGIAADTTTFASALADLEPCPEPPGGDDWNVPPWADESTASMYPTESPLV
jgi:hypothetical protein